MTLLSSSIIRIPEEIRLAHRWPAEDLVRVARYNGMEFVRG